MPLTSAEPSVKHTARYTQRAVAGAAGDPCLRRGTFPLSSMLYAITISPKALIAARVARGLVPHQRRPIDPRCLHGHIDLAEGLHPFVTRRSGLFLGGLLWMSCRGSTAWT